MPIPAAAWNRVAGIAVIADIKNGPERTASAVSDIFNGFFMELRHTVSIKFQVLPAVNPEDILYSTHDSTPCIT